VYCLHHYDDEYTPLKRRSTSRLHSTISQNAVNYQPKVGFPYHNPKARIANTGN